MAQIIPSAPWFAGAATIDVANGEGSAKPAQPPRLPLDAVSNTSEGPSRSARRDTPPRLTPGFVATRAALWEAHASSSKTPPRPYARRSDATGAASVRGTDARQIAPLARKAGLRMQAGERSLRSHDERHPTRLVAEAERQMLRSAVADRPLRSELHPNGILARATTEAVQHTLALALGDICNRRNDADIALIAELHARCAPAAASTVADEPAASTDIFGNDWSDAVYTADEQQALDAIFEQEEAQWRSRWDSPATAADSAADTAQACTTEPTSLLEQIQRFHATGGLRSTHLASSEKTPERPALLSEIEGFDRSRNLRKVTPDDRPSNDGGKAGALHEGAKRMFERHFSGVVQSTEGDDSDSGWDSDA